MGCNKLCIILQYINGNNYMGGVSELVFMMD